MFKDWVFFVALIQIDSSHMSNVNNLSGMLIYQIMSQSP